MRTGIIVLAALALPLAGCASTTILPPMTSTEVDLSRSNYRVVRANAMGASRGVKVLGLVPVWAATYNAAMSDLYAEIGPTEGRSIALVNCIHERTNLYFVLFSIPQRTVRADVIEFLDGSVPPRGAP